MKTSKNEIRQKKKCAKKRPGSGDPVARGVGDARYVSSSVTRVRWKIKDMEACQIDSAPPPPCATNDALKRVFLLLIDWSVCAEQSPLPPCMCGIFCLVWRVLVALVLLSLGFFSRFFFKLSLRACFYLFILPPPLFLLVRRGSGSGPPGLQFILCWFFPFVHEKWQDPSVMWGSTLRRMNHPSSLKW